MGCKALQLNQAGSRHSFLHAYRCQTITLLTAACPQPHAGLHRLYLPRRPLQDVPTAL